MAFAMRASGRMIGPASRPRATSASRMQRSHAAAALGLM